MLTEKKNGTVVNAMTYDNYGNIKTKNGVAYTYGNAQWKDLLTKVGNQTITYDAQGNPTSYLGHTLTWEKGRQLKSFDTNTYTYNANGIRTSKTVNGVTHTYTLDGTKTLKEVWGNNTLVPLYDNEDSICGIEYNGSAYWFYKNLQGDIISIANAGGDVIAKYTYDAWGKVCSIIDTDGNAITDSTNIAIINPFRYMGYYYDTEIGMYYLQSRYYDPSVGRFINADDADYLEANKGFLGNNLFAYCENNPVNTTDSTGYYSDSTWPLLWLLCKNLLLVRVLRSLFIGRFLFFFKVKNGGEWDYKVNKPSWVSGKKFKAFGLILTTEQLGNFNYGLTGAAMYFSPAVLFAGGGFVAIRGNSAGQWKYYFDSRADHFWVALGILAYSFLDPHYRKVNSLMSYVIKKFFYRYFLAIYKYFKTRKSEWVVL